MKRTGTLLLLLIIVLQPYVLMSVRLVESRDGYAKVYILCLSDVPCSNFGIQESHLAKLRVKEGAIRAIEFKESGMLPLAHAKLSEQPPFYGVDYQVVADWALYKNIVEGYREVIIVNAHGEILPIPTGYNAMSWVGKIAEAMLKRGVSWVHTGGYPFYRIWNQGAVQSEEWPSTGANGFKNFTSYINIAGATCWPSVGETERARLHEDAWRTIKQSWELDNAMEVDLGRPLSSSVFRNYVDFCIWGNKTGEMAGAVVAFVKPSERVLPEERYGCGYYVHIGTRNTFTVGGIQTDGDYNRGYVGTAVAVLAVAGAQKPTSATKEYAGYPYSHWGISVAPAVTKYQYVTDNAAEIDISFAIYGCMKTNTSKSIGEVEFQLSGLPDYCKAQLICDYSTNAIKVDRPTVEIDWTGLAEVGVGALLYAIDYYSTGGTVSTIIAALGGPMLFSDFVALAPHITLNGSGVIQPDHSVDISYNPTKNSTQMGGYTHQEFEAILHIRIFANMTNRSQWNAIPMQWWIGLHDGYSWGVWTSGDVSLVAFRPYSYWENPQAVAMFEDFSDGTAGWTVADLNPAAGYDYWTVLKNDPPGCIVYCAGEGENSVKGGLNKEIIWYDKCMNAIMERRVDLRAYRFPRIHYFIRQYGIAEGDYLAIEYYQDGAWITSSTTTGSPFEGWREANLSSSAEKIRFRFYSNDDNNIDRGVDIDGFEIVGDLPNDASNGTDAGQGFDSALWVRQPGSYAGYLNGEVDCYNFTVTSQNISQGKEIHFSIEMPQYSLFKIELYSPLGQLKSSSGIYTFVSSDSPGQWMLNISTIKGFGPYGFRIELMDPSGGGGCPVLLTHDNPDYVDYGVINIHNAEGQDVIKEVEIASDDVSIESYVVRMRLREGWEGLAYSHSSIDQVKLYAVDSYGNRYLCPLLGAMYSEQGNVLLRLMFSDDWKVDIYLKETIDMQFLVPYPRYMVRGFVFVIEGHNVEKSGW